MSYKVFILKEADATPEEKEEFEYCWKDYRSVLVIEIDGQRTYEIDRGEPEDNCFGRDWKWVIPALQAAYQAGLRDGPF